MDAIGFYINRTKDISIFAIKCKKTISSTSLLLPVVQGLLRPFRTWALCWLSRTWSTLGCWLGTLRTPWGRLSICGCWWLWEPCHGCPTCWALICAASATPLSHQLTPRAGKTGMYEPLSVKLIRPRSLSLSWGCDLRACSCSLVCSLMRSLRLACQLSVVVIDFAAILAILLQAKLNSNQYC